MAALIWVTVMDTSFFVFLVAAWLLVISVALASTIVLTAAEYEPQGISPFHRFLLVLARCGIATHSA